MVNKIFKSIMSVAITVIVSSILIITGVLYKYFGTIQQVQLKDQLNIAANATSQLGLDYLKSLNFDTYRMTWVSKTGDVIFDSHVDSNSMENHKDREEIKEALTTGKGSSVRNSSTLTEQTFYEALRLEDGSVLRISTSRATVLVLVLGMIQPILFIFILAVIFSAWLSHRMAKRVVDPLNKLNLDEPLENDSYEELSPLLNRIHMQHEKINFQMNELKRKQEEFNQITSNMKEGLVLLDNKYRIISINPAATTIFNAYNDCIGKDFLTVYRKTNMISAINKAMEDGHSTIRERKDNNEYQFDITRIDSSTTTNGLVILAVDITERVNAEKNRREFTANVSHELKTPLQSIIGSAELIENGIVKQDDMPKFIGRIRKEASRLVFLIDDIIRLSQLDEEAELPREDVSLKVLSEEVCDILSDSAKMKNISIDVSGDDGIINGVRQLLFEVIYNLCDNAIKYNKPNGNVHIKITDEENGVYLNISDTGIGIAQEHQHKIFERFYRVDKSHSKLSGGTGLGLSIVKHAVQYHHGKIDIQSELGKGTTISVFFNKK